jgi:hypothetical protein
MSNAILARAAGERFVRAALLVGGCVLVVALAILPFAAGRSGTAGLGGVGLAAAICLLAAWAAEALAWMLDQRVSPLGLMLLGMAIRMLPPLAICVGLAAKGASGRQHMAFIVYLLAFYMVTLALETWLTVQRVALTSAAIQTAQPSVR